MKITRRTGKLVMAVAPVVGAVGVAIGLGLPFLVVGESSRSAYSLVRSARNLNVLTGPVRSVLGISVVLIPMLAGALLCSLALSYRRVAIALSGAVGVLGCAASCSALLVPRSSFRLLGPITTMSGGILLVGTAAFSTLVMITKADGEHDGFNK